MLSWTEAYMSWSEPTMHRLHKPPRLQCFQVLWQITCQNQTTPQSQFRIDFSFKTWFSLWNPTVSLQGSKFVIWHSYDATLAGPISIRLCYGKWISNLLPTRLSSNSICAVVRSSSKDMMDLNGFDVLAYKQIERPVSFWGPLLFNHRVGDNVVSCSLQLKIEHIARQRCVCLVHISACACVCGFRWVQHVVAYMN